MIAQYVLRDLPGVAELEAMIQRIQAHPNPLWASENDDVVVMAAQLVSRHFGIELDDPREVFEQASGPLRPGEPVWLRNIWLEGGEDSDEEARQWRALGWDVRDAVGKILLSLAFFDVAILAAIQGNGPARLPDAPKTDAEIERSVAAFEAKLAADAAKFQSKRRVSRP